MTMRSEPYRIRPEQFRAARAMLDWSLRRLAAEAELSLGVIVRIEGKGVCKATEVSRRRVQAVLEANGITFVRRNAVRLWPPEDKQ